MTHVTVERREAVKDALDPHRQGLDFADALLTFDDRRFARRARRLALLPEVRVPVA